MNLQQSLSPMHIQVSTQGKYILRAKLNSGLVKITTVACVRVEGSSKIGRLGMFAINMFHSMHARNTNRVMCEKLILERYNVLTSWAIQKRSAATSAVAPQGY